MRTVKQILEDANFDPVDEMVKMAQELEKDYKSATEDLDSYADTPQMKREIILQASKIQKLRGDVIKGVSDSRQREIDQQIKIEDSLRREQIEREKLIAKQGEDNPDKKSREYFVPTYKRKVLPNGKTQMVKVDLNADT